MGVEVDEAGGDDTIRGVDAVFVGRPVQGHRDVDDDPVVDADVGAACAALVDDCSAGDEHATHESLSRSRPLPSRSNRTAMRTAMPLVTCCVMTEPGSSDGSTAIS